MGEIWGAAVAVVGIGASLYGANKQSKADAAANAANIAAHEKDEQQNWLKYLQTRGIVAPPDTPTGVVPGRSAGQSMNTRLPLWMNVTNPSSTAPKGTVAGDPATTQPFLVDKHR